MTGRSRFIAAGSVVALLLLITLTALLVAPKICSIRGGLNRLPVKLVHWVCPTQVADVSSLKRTGDVFGDAGFQLLPIPVSVWDLNDIGVADINSDEHLDIYTTNHSAQSSFALSRGGFRFEDRSAALGLSQDRLYPGFHQSALPGPYEASGVYIERVGSRLLQLSSVGGDLPTFNGQIRFETPARVVQHVGKEVGMTAAVRVIHANGFEATVETGADNDRVDQVIVNFRSDGQGRLLLETLFPELPYYLDFSPDLDPERIYIGANRERPASNAFKLTLRDRHGVAFFDLNGDGHQDLYIARGGLRGQMSHFATALHDELFLTDPAGGYEDQIQMSGLNKQNCPARQVSLQDFDRDGLLDIYVVCGRWDLETFPNQLWRQTEQGRFEEVASRAGLDLGEIGAVLWLDVDANGRPDLLYLTRNAITLYRNKGERFEAELLMEQEGGRLPSLSLADFDTDGHMDVLVVGKSVGILKASDGTLRYERAEEYGLPARARVGAWVDYDNDGYLDAHFLPGGIWKQQPGGKFKPTGLAGFGESGPMEARVAWFDADRDGRRDALVAVQQDLQGQWDGALLRNLADSGNWLTVVLRGLPGNREAIGARVRVRSGGRDAFSVVGAADTARFSSGHYYLYFGLGDSGEVTELEVTWPLGDTTVLRDTAANQVLVISHPDREVAQGRWNKTGNG